MLTIAANVGLQGKRLSSTTSWHRTMERRSLLWRMSLVSTLDPWLCRTGSTAALKAGWQLSASAGRTWLQLPGWLSQPVGAVGAQPEASKLIEVSHSYRDCWPAGEVGIDDALVLQAQEEVTGPSHSVALAGSPRRTGMWTVWSAICSTTPEAPGTALSSS